MILLSYTAKAGSSGEGPSMTRPAPGGLAALGFHGAGGIAGALQDPARLVMLSRLFARCSGFYSVFTGLVE